MSDSAGVEFLGKGRLSRARGKRKQTFYSGIKMNGLEYHRDDVVLMRAATQDELPYICLLYTSPSPRDRG